MHFTQKSAQKETVMETRRPALTTEQYIEIITAMKESGCNSYPNDSVITAIVLDGIFGLRISELTSLRLCDFASDGGTCHLAITEKKTGKQRTLAVQPVLLRYVENYCLRNRIERNEKMFPIPPGIIRKQLAITCERLGYSGISMHSFRRWHIDNCRNDGFDSPLIQMIAP